MVEAVLIAIGVGTLIFAYLSWRSSSRAVKVNQEQAELTREQVRRSPRINVQSGSDGHELLELPGESGVGVLRIKATNDGDAVAPELYAWIWLDAEFFWPLPDAEHPGVTQYQGVEVKVYSDDPRDGRYVVYATRNELSPHTSLVLSIPVEVRQSGNTSIFYRVGSNAGGGNEGWFYLDVLDGH